MCWHKIHLLNQLILTESLGIVLLFTIYVIEYVYLALRYMSLWIRPVGNHAQVCLGLQMDCWKKLCTISAGNTHTTSPGTVKNIIFLTLLTIPMDQLMNKVNE